MAPDMNILGWIVGFTLLGGVAGVMLAGLFLLGPERAAGGGLAFPLGLPTGAVLGGALVPSPGARLLVLGSPAGASSLQFAWPAGMPAGLRVFTQGWLIGATGPQGWTATNALQATVL